MKSKIVVLTGAGISAESGIPTFRDANGLWEGYDVMEVASIQGWHKNPKRVLDFYNQRRAGVRLAHPNRAHLVLKELEEYFDVTVVTQNIDNLHEKAGSSKIIHLHGEILKARSTINSDLVYDLGEKDIHWGDCCKKGSQLRPNIVWFGEAVPMMEMAIQEVHEAQILLVVGTSLVVYPAAGLINYLNSKVPVFVVDPNKPEIYCPGLKINYFVDSATKGMEKVMKVLLDQYL